MCIRDSVSGVKGAKVIDASSQTVIPGLIDAGGTAGTRAEALVPGFGAGQGSSGAGKTADFRLADSIDPRDPSLMELVRAGITTVLITPPSAGQVSALKLAAADPAKALFRPYAAQFFTKSSSKTLKSAKAYHDSWIQFDKKKEAAAAIPPATPKCTTASILEELFDRKAIPSLNIARINAPSIPVNANAMAFVGSQPESLTS